MALSFKHTRGQQILRRLASVSDVLVENYLPGTLARYGLGYEQLRQANPRLIYASITGCVQDTDYDPHYHAVPRCIYGGGGPGLADHCTSCTDTARRALTAAGPDTT